MKTKLLQVVGLLGLSLCSAAHANQTPANDVGGGNTVFFDRHSVSCGFQAISSVRLIRPSEHTIAFDYQCQNAGETVAHSNYTPPNDDGGGNSIFLDRHGIDCNNKPLQYIHLYRPTGNQIAYHYKCGNETLFNVTDHYTPANDDGGGNSIFLDRHHVSCPAGKVLSYMRLQRPSGNTIRYHYRCGEPHTKHYKEIRIQGGCFDGSLVNHGDDVYLHDCHGGNNQKWLLDGDGLIRSRHNTQLCIDLYFGTSWDFNPGDDARLSYCNVNNPNQRFAQISTTFGVALVSNDGHGMCLRKPHLSSDLRYDHCSFDFNEMVSFHDSDSMHNQDVFTHLNNQIPNNLLNDLAGAFHVDDLRIEQFDPYGTTRVTGRVRNMNNNNLMGRAIQMTVDLRKYLVNDNRNDIPFIINLTNQGNGNFEAKINFEMVRGWREVDPQMPFGTKMILQDADLVLKATYTNGELSRRVGVEGNVYLKPSALDSWLYVNPAVERDIGADPTTDYGLTVKGACPAKPTTGTNGSSYCTQNWNVFNAHVMTARSEQNGGENFIQVSMVGSNPTGGKVKIRHGQFLGTADVNAEWEGDEEGSRGTADVQLNGLDNKVMEVINQADFIGVTNYVSLSSAYTIHRVGVSRETLSSQTKLHVDLTVMGEDVEVIYIPGNQGQSYLESAQANHDLMLAVADAIGRVIANKTPLGKLVNLINSGLEVVGLRDGARVVFDAAGHVGSAAQTAGETICTYVLFGAC